MIQDECGVFGVWARGEEVAKLAYFGLYAVQHRGQESAGIAVSNGEHILIYKDEGLVSQVFHERDLAALQGHIAVAHTRYSTNGGRGWHNAQPILQATGHGSLAFAHNGSLTNVGQLREFLAKRGKNRQQDNRGNSDSAVLSALLASYPDLSLAEAAIELLPKVKGAFSLVFMDNDTLYAARDPQGVRPLALGRLGSAEGAAGWVVASETAALDIVGARYVRDVEPGELITINEHGLISRKFAAAQPKGCIFEYVYLARPDTKISGRSVYATRVEVGRALAREAPADADIVIPVPESGIPSAIGFAQESGIPYDTGVIKNGYVGRTFIQPSQTLRQLGIRLKLNPLREVIAGKRLVVVDDSIVRGNTQQALVQMLRNAGAREVHVRISSPPVEWPCFYGVDFATRAELIAANLPIEQIRESIGADSLGYVSLDGLVAATAQPRDSMCLACFDGIYPIPVEGLTLAQSGCEAPSALADFDLPDTVNAAKAAKI